MRALVTSADGRFTKRLLIWDGSDWDAGWPDDEGRFRVYRPDYPRAYSGGYALRAHVVWWLAYGAVHPIGSDIHHLNGIKSDDRLDNLEVKGHGDHSRDHKAMAPITLTCQGCGGSFQRTAKVVHSRIHSGRAIRYCSNECYQRTPRTDAHKQAIADGLRRAYALGLR